MKTFFMCGTTLYHSESLGKKFDKRELNINIIKSLNGWWQLRVTNNFI